MTEFFMRLPFAILGAYIGGKRGGIIRMFIYSFIGCIVGDALIILL